MPSQEPITVVLARFDDLLAGGLRELLEGDPSLELVAADVEHGRIPTVLRGHRPDVAVLDAHQLIEVDQIQELGRSYPATRLVLIARDASASECAKALAFGASAYLSRDTQARDLLNAIHLASRGLQVTPRIRARPGDSRPGSQLLTQRELQVLPLLQRGRSNAEIALELSVGVETVRTHTRNIYRKLGVSSRHELASPPSDPEGPFPDARVERPAPPAPHAGAEQPARKRTPSRPSRRRRGHGPLPRR